VEFHIENLTTEEVRSSPAAACPHDAVVESSHAAARASRRQR
jgi:hypothetical protein